VETESSTFKDLGKTRAENPGRESNPVLAPCARSQPHANAHALAWAKREAPEQGTGSWLWDRVKAERPKPCDATRNPARLPRREGIATSFAMQHCNRFLACHHHIELCLTGESESSVSIHRRRATRIPNCRHSTVHDTTQDCDDKPYQCRRVVVPNFDTD